MDQSQTSRLWQRLVAGFHVPQGLRRHFGWTTSSYLAGQVIRFAANLILTRILAPELFGIMMLLTSIRVGLELFTDIGIGQNVIASRDAYDARFYNTAWTMQIARGAIIALISVTLIPLLSHFYPQRELTQILPIISVLFILTGTHSVGLSLAVKSLQTKKMAYFDLICTFTGSALSIAIALFFPNIWGLVAGNVAATLVTSAGSYFVFPGLQYRILIDRRHARDIIGFGKWIFVSSIVFFLATNYDRLILAKYVTLATLGVYGIARSLGDVFSQFATRIGNAIIFPSIAVANLRGAELQLRLQKRRAQFVIAALVGLSAFIALSDFIVRMLYDVRYEAASQLLPWVGLAAWIGILNTLNDSVMLGLNRPHYSALGNVVKFMALVIMLPLGVVHYGIGGAAAAAVAAELCRYVALTVAQTIEGVRFTRQDIASTLTMLLLAFAIRGITHQIGLSDPPTIMFNISVK